METYSYLKYYKNINCTKIYLYILKLSDQKAKIHYTANDSHGNSYRELLNTNHRLIFYNILKIFNSKIFHPQ